MMGPDKESAADGLSLRPMQRGDLFAAHGLTSEIRWPHRAADWELAFRLGEGVVAERDGAVVGTALRWRWDARHATIGLVVVAASCRGRRIGHRLMQALLEDMGDCTVLLHATADGRGLYERLGFARIGELRQHQGIARPTPPTALARGWRLRPAGATDLGVLQALDEQARGMARARLVEALFEQARSSVVLDHDGQARGFAMLRRFGRGLLIGPVVAPDTQGAQALIGHLAGLNAGRFTRIDIDFDSGLAEWLEQLGLRRVDAPVTMVRGEAPQASVGQARLFAVVTQALG
jgi:N-acetylglutamate synthase-like GNAT family acetyltransferase